MPIKPYREPGTGMTGQIMRAIRSQIGQTRRTRRGRPNPLWPAAHRTSRLWTAVRKESLAMGFRSEPTSGVTGKIALPPHTPGPGRDRHRQSCAAFRMEQASLPILRVSGRSVHPTRNPDRRSKGTLRHGHSLVSKPGKATPFSRREPVHDLAVDIRGGRGRICPAGRRHD